jgi:hypothetical protein
MKPVLFEVEPSIQEVFNAAVMAVAQSKRQSVIIVNGQKSCRYRGPDGNFCIVGAVLPDEYYHPALEMRDVACIVDNFELPDFFRRYKWQLLDMQSEYDAAENLWDLTRGLQIVTRNWGLDDAVLNLLTEFKCDCGVGR